MPSAMRSRAKSNCCCLSEQGKEAKNGLAAPLAASEGRSDSVSLLERGGSTFSVESGDGAPERRRSFQVRSMGQGRAGAAVACMQCQPAAARHQRISSVTTALLF